LSNEDKGEGASSTTSSGGSRRGCRDGPPPSVFLNFLEAHFPYHQTPPRFLARFTQRGALERRDVSIKAMAAQFGRWLSDEEDSDTVAGEIWLRMKGIYDMMRADWLSTHHTE
jgi:hypothetical protein